jgi:hypothetical protein
MSKVLKFGPCGQAGLEMGEKNGLSVVDLIGELLFGEFLILIRPSKCLLFFLVG